ncbi:threonylcarbamoyl-AMP synthase [candidate division LCP-89 bacterium B3_LCP]|uniref:L-threonylcarbamoyladenylate synthase n=1 Tax=candidate division LCP-89 bacterium B3_LCP TaxID=2012998 RepID=A0A532V3E7_UNCL8|nr:MAG: threonylcarbamoyl-AMP synthase [candidate division LCP-89 bacterium B3_LCP]
MTDTRVRKALQVLNDGGVIIYPTETVYGIGCLDYNNQGIERIAKIKESGPEQSFIILVKDIGSIEFYCIEVPQFAYKLTQRFWPGPLTIVLLAKESLHPRLIGSSGGVALRQSPHPLTAQLLRNLDAGLISTSANLSGHKAPKSIEEIDLKISQSVDYILNGDDLKGGVSTVIDLCSKEPKIIRHGAVSTDDINECLSLK